MLSLAKIFIFISQGHILLACGIVHFGHRCWCVTTADLCMCVCACYVFLQALEKAKEAGRKERALVRQREQSGNAEHINLDLTYSVSKAAVHQ